MFDPTKPVQARNGRKAEILKHDINNDVYKIAAVVTDRDGTQELESYDINGYYNPERGESISDLINIPEKIVRYVNMNKNERGIVGAAYETKRRADNNSTSYRIACIRIEFEDGQFDD